jgi:hypothetical protein
MLQLELFGEKLGHEINNKNADFVSIFYVLIHICAEQLYVLLQIHNQIVGFNFT